METVTPDGPADKAGIKGGDTITEFDGERVRSTLQFSRLVQETPAGPSGCGRRCCAPGSA